MFARPFALPPAIMAINVSKQQVTVAEELAEEATDLSRRIRSAAKQIDPFTAKFEKAIKGEVA